MKQIPKSKTRLLALTSALLSLLCFVARSADTEAKPGYTRFSQWGISFDYPKEWQEFPAGQSGMMKSVIASQAKPYGRELQEFTAFTAGESMFMVAKYTTDKPMSASDFVKERNTAYDEAKRAGDVTKVNYVREATVAKLPAVEEDVERSNGGRGRTLKVINGTTVFELMFAVRTASSFSSQTNALNQVVFSIVVGSPKPAGSQKNAPAVANRYIFTKDVLGDLQLEIQKDVYLLTITKPGATVSTLTFSDPCKLRLILKDKTLLAEQESVTATDTDGKIWKSQKVKLGDEEVFAFFQQE